MKSGLNVIFVAFALLILSSCSTTRVLKEDQYRLQKNRIEITNDQKFNPSQLNKYLKQNESLGWSPFLYVYNWTNGKNGPWDRFVQRIGKAPVIYNPELVETSVENIENHLEYIGYYGSRVNAEIRANGKKVNVPSYLLKAGDEIAIKDKSKESDKIKATVEANASRPVPQWLDLNAEALTGKVLALPTREQIMVPVEEHLIVELYSK